MQSKNLELLENIMGRYQNDTVGIQTEREKEKMVRAEFDKEFERLKKDVIWPVIVDIGNELTKYGHDYHVNENNEHLDATAHFYPSNITFSIYPATLNAAYRKPESAPYISFVADPYAKKISIMVSTMMPETGGDVGEHGTYETSQITPELVEKEILKVLKKTFIFDKI